MIVMALNHMIDSADTKIVNMSFGYFDAVSVRWNWWSPWHRWSDDRFLLAAKRALANNRKRIASAENDTRFGRDLDFWNNDNNVQYFPCSFQFEVVCVWAVDRNLTIASFSNFGPAVDIFAYGGTNTLGGTPSSFDRAPGVFTANGWCYPCQFNATNFSQNFPSPSFGGTSLAAPLVAGVAALMAEVRPSLTVTELRNILRGVRFASPTPQVNQDGGVMDAINAVIGAGGVR